MGEQHIVVALAQPFVQDVHDLVAAHAGDEHAVRLAGREHGHAVAHPAIGVDAEIFGARAQALDRLFSLMSVRMTRLALPVLIAAIPALP